jgi:hypothetical protein
MTERQRNTVSSDHKSASSSTGNTAFEAEHQRLRIVAILQRKSELKVQKVMIPAL